MRFGYYVHRIPINNFIIKHSKLYMNKIQIYTKHNPEQIHCAKTFPSLYHNP